MTNRRLRLFSHIGHHICACAPVPAAGRCSQLWLYFRESAGFIYLLNTNLGAHIRWTLLYTLKSKLSLYLDYVLEYLEELFHYFTTVCHTYA